MISVVLGVSLACLYLDLCLPLICELAFDYASVCSLFGFLLCWFLLVVWLLVVSLFSDVINSVGLAYFFCCVLLYL